MNKSELVKAIAEKAGISQAAGKAALEATLESIAGALKKGDSVQLIGFGTFSVAERAARKGKNPQTGQVINIPAKKVANAHGQPRWTVPRCDRSPHCRSPSPGLNFSSFFHGWPTMFVEWQGPWN